MVIGGTGQPTVPANIGRVSFTVTRKSLGVYWINYNTAYPSSNYIPSVILYGATGTVVVGGSTSAALLEVVMLTIAGLNMDASFFFKVF